MVWASLAGWLANTADQLPATGSTEKTKESFMAEMKAENIKQFLRSVGHAVWWTLQGDRSYWAQHGHCKHTTHTGVTSMLLAMPHFSGQISLPMLAQCCPPMPGGTPKSW